MNSYRPTSFPALFQNPSADVQLNSNLDLLATTDPNSLWQNRVSNVPISGQMSGFNVCPDPQDPPLTNKERYKLQVQLDVVATRTLNNEQPTLMFCAFFSKKNILNLQHLMIKTVNKWSGHVIGYQSEQDLVLLMLQVYEKSARQIDELNAPSRAVMKHIKNEVVRLNELVIQEAVPAIIDGVEQHLAFTKQWDSGVTEGLQRPEDTNITGTRYHRSFSDVMTGGYVYP